MRAAITFLILLMMPLLGHGQIEHEGYVDFSIDPNKALGIIDNPRTEVDHRGIDWDLEIGLIIPKADLKWYVYYGKFDAMNWTNYGTGIDYYLERGDWYDVAVGLQVNFINHPFEVYDEDGGFAFNADYNANSLGFGARLAGVFWVFRNYGISGRFQYITRPDLEKTFGIIEGSVGMTFKF